MAALSPRRPRAFTLQGAVALAGLVAVALAAFHAQGNGAWLFALLLSSAGMLSWWRAERRLAGLRLELPGPPVLGPAPWIPIRCDGLPRCWLTAVVRHADGRDIRGAVQRIAAGDGRMLLPAQRSDAVAVVAIEASDRWPWGWFAHHRRWDCHVPLGAVPTTTPVATDDDLTGLRPWRPGDGLGRLVWRRLHHGLFARDFTTHAPSAAPPRILHTHDLHHHRVLATGPDRTTVALIVASLLVGTLGLAAIVPLALVVGGPLLGAWCWWRCHRQQGRLGSAWRWLIFAGAAAGLWATGQVRVNFDSGVPAFLALAWIKTLELDSDREVHVVSTLALFANGACLLTDGGLAMFAVALAGATLAGAALARHHGGPQTVRPLVYALPIAVLLFLVVPRPTLGTTTLGAGAVAQSGITSVLSPDAVAANLDDPTPAFRAETEPTDTHDWYWRAHVLWDCDDRGSAWRPGIEPFLFRGDPPVRSGTPPRTATCRVTLLPGTTPAPSLGVLRHPPRGYAAAFGGVLRARTTTTPIYELDADLDARDVAASETALRRALLVPRSLDPRVIDIGRSLARESPHATAAALVAWMHAQDFAYDLRPGTTDDGMAGFLLRTHRGFCAHFAAGGALLLRAAGVPARIITGWRGGEWNSLGGHLLVRHQHAHAWCEYWAGTDQGWVRLDLTDTVPSIDPATGRSDGVPRGGLAPTHPDTWWTALRLLPDYVAARWDQVVLGYDAEQRQHVLEHLPQPWVLMLLVALTGLGWWWWRRRQHDPLDTAYLQFLRALARLGVPRDPHEGPAEHLHRAAHHCPHLATTIRRGGEAYLRLAYARTPHADDLQTLGAATRTLRRAPRQRA